MKHYVGVVLLMLIVSSTISTAQNMPIGTWQTHFNYQDITHLESSESKVFAASSFGFFTYNLDNQSIRRISKADGLSDVGITAMHYEASENALIMGYASGFVDIIFENEIVTINDIANSRLDKEKSIYDIVVFEESLYLATSIGVIVANLNDGIIRENFLRIGSNGEELEVYEIEIQRDTIIINTQFGTQYGALELNLLDFNNWVRLDERVTSIAGLNGVTYGLTSNGELTKFCGDWVSSDLFTDTPVLDLFDENGSLFIQSDESLYQLNNSQPEIVASLDERINDVTWVKNQLFFASELKGLVHENGQSIIPNGPHTDSFSRLKLIDNQLFAFNAPPPFGYSGNKLTNTYSLLTSGIWEAKSIDQFYNISDVASLNNNLYFSSIGDGLYDESNKEIIVDLQSTGSQSDTVLSFVESHNDDLWIGNYANPYPLVRKSINDSWQSFTSDSLGADGLEDVEFSVFGTLWMINNNERISLFDPINKVPLALSSTRGISSSVNEIAISSDDEAWITTNRGPNIVFGASFVGPEVRATTPSFDNQILFENEPIKTLVIDGGDRLWFGKQDGLWLFNKSTTELIQHFTVNNSPLPSNNILKLVYNPNNGELFIATDKGMVSYRTASTGATELHKNVKIFPNPIRRNYEGHVGISGLANNVNIKITDVNGNLVNSLNSNGGTASWDLTNLKEQRTKPGVYFFFSSTEDGMETFVGKLAVIE